MSGGSPSAIYDALQNGTPESSTTAQPSSCQSQNNSIKSQTNHPTKNFKAIWKNVIIYFTFNS